MTHTSVKRIGSALFEIGSFRSQTCSGMSRRTFLRVSAFVLLALGIEETNGQFRVPEPVQVIEQVDCIRGLRLLRKLSSGVVTKGSSHEV
jgi:hypothetical protein